jgi:hypothetical protein
MRSAYFAKTGQQFRQLKDSGFAKSRTAWRCWFSVAWLLKSVSIGFGVFASGQGVSGFFPSHAFAFERDAMGIVDDAIEDGIGDGRLTDHVVPLGDGELGGDQRRFAPIAFFEDFQEIEALLIIEGVSAPVVEHQQLHAGEFVDEAREATVETCHGKLFKQARDPQIEDGKIQPGFAGPGLASEDEFS